MKKWVAFLFICCLANNFSQTNISPQFSELKGMEDQLGESNLLPVEILNLYPLAVGNRWVYLTTTIINPTVLHDVKAVEVIGDTIPANGKLYFHLKDADYHYLDRVDSLDGKVYRFYEHPNLPESEYVIANLMGEVGDTLITFSPSSPGSQSFLVVTNVDTFYKWGLTKYRKNFTQMTFPIFYRFSLTEDISLDFSVSTYIGYSMSLERTLKGCVIDGIVYGDTTLTGIDDEEIPIASEFKLEQNYPNPFNPSTKIKFTIPTVIASGAKQSQLVTLKVYDVLGNEIATLVNEEKTAGEYEVEFSPESSIKQPASGIYFYQLKAGRYSETKKMVLLK